MSVVNRVPVLRFVESIKAIRVRPLALGTDKSVNIEKLSVISIE
jgi:hypothetical protein